MDQQQPMPSWVVVVIVALLIFVFLGAALFIINPGAVRSLFNSQAASHPTAAPATVAPTLPPTQANTPAPAASSTVTIPPSAAAATDAPATIDVPTATDKPAATATQPPAAATPAPTLAPTQAPTVAKSPTPTDVPLNPDRAEFVTDVTVPDGTVFAPGAAFTKTWRIKNVGPTTWTSQYTLEFTVGAQIPVLKKVPFPKDVAPGDTMDISMDMIAPATGGDHTALFQFRNASGQPFGVGPRYNEAIYIKITVSEVTPTP